VDPVELELELEFVIDVDGDDADAGAGADGEVVTEGGVPEMDVGGGGGGYLLATSDDVADFVNGVERLLSKSTCGFCGGITLKEDLSLDVGVAIGGVCPNVAVEDDGGVDGVFDNGGGCDKLILEVFLDKLDTDVDDIGMTPSAEIEE
jgi:hypothetical protein